MQFCELEGRLYMEKKKGETAATYTKKHKYPRYVQQGQTESSWAHSTYPQSSEIKPSDPWGSASSWWKNSIWEKREVSFTTIINFD